jgi:uncharacterized protein
MGNLLRLNLLASARSKAAAAPTGEKGRIELIDALRGLAMMGIILVNFPSVNTLPGKEATTYGFASGPLDNLFAQANMFLLNGKVYPIFALLFGLGMAIFLQHAQEKGADARGLMRRRLGFLALIGLLHITLVWWGDILLIYAAMGCAALPFYQRSTAVFRRWIVLLLTVLPGIYYGIYLVRPELLKASVRIVRFSTEPDAAIHQIYQHEGFFAVSRERLFNYLDYASPLFRTTLDDFLMINNYYAQIFALVLLGLWLGKNKWHRESKTQQKAVDYFWRLGCGFLVSVALIYQITPAFRQYLYYPINAVCACFYILSFIKAYRWPAFRHFANFFTATGKISMTVYLAHTTCASLLLYGYGMGYYGNVGPAWVIIAGGACALSLSAAANLWVLHFHFGPFEWLWRGATYGKLPALVRKEKPQVKARAQAFGGIKKNR